MKREKTQMIYLDNAATTYPKPEKLYEAMDYGNRYLAINAGRGSYQLAKAAVQKMEEVREKILHQIHGERAGEAVITSSATIAMNQIIGGLMLTPRDIVYVSPFEHNAVMRTLYKEQRQKGFSIEELPLVRETLEIDLDKTEYMFDIKPPSVVCITHVSNVTGYILPIEEIFALTKKITKEEGKVILDAAQSFGIVPIDYRQTPFDAVVFAGHKTLYGPIGIGGFIKHRDFHLEPFLAGGTGSNSLDLSMPEEIDGLEPGSPNIPAVTGLCASLSWIEEVGAKKIFAHKKNLTELCIKELKNIRGVQVYTPVNPDKRIGVVSFSMEYYNVNEVAGMLDTDYHIAVRSGYHCAPLIHSYLQDQEYGGTIRASFSWFNTEEEIQILAESIQEIVEG
ncbi:MAG: aminotransferase class V-fold PLP-dependent enzyme [Lachnospiraceae bacterium]|nr:aminotransferase class V-fold PLP-dependent enzyme [Lachnospiraceae bacterium]